MQNTPVFRQFTFLEIPKVLLCLFVSYPANSMRFACFPNINQRPAAPKEYTMRTPIHSLSLLIFAGLCLAATPAQARPEKAGQTAQSRFDAMDENKDGTLSREEFFKALPGMREEAFAAIDTEGNGTISVAEWNAFFSNHGKPAEGEQGMGMGMGQPQPNENGEAAKQGGAPKQDLVMPSRNKK